MGQFSSWGFLFLQNVNRKKKQFNIKIVVQPDFIPLEKVS